MRIDPRVVHYRHEFSVFRRSEAKNTVIYISYNIVIDLRLRYKIIILILMEKENEKENGIYVNIRYIHIRRSIKIDI